jgi:hypothetical protein
MLDGDPASAGHDRRDGVAPASNRDFWLPCFASEVVRWRARRKKFHLADFFGPEEFYEPQLKFFAEGKTHHQRLLRGGNQVGKSFAAAFEASLHMSGQYPKWWPGKKFDKPTPKDKARSCCLTANFARRC